ncbi:MAG: hypothetical protein P1P76_10375 [Anaerolineales bacterium]|nr:hypothetical protein [Anaerolineales bacterium]
MRIAFLSKLYLALRIPEVDVPTLFKDQREAILNGLSTIENSHSGLDPSQRILRQSLRLRIMQLRSLLTWLTECQDANIFE